MTYKAYITPQKPREPKEPEKSFSLETTLLSYEIDSSYKYVDLVKKIEELKQSGKIHDINNVTLYFNYYDGDRELDIEETTIIENTEYEAQFKQYEAEILKYNADMVKYNEAMVELSKKKEVDEINEFYSKYPHLKPK